MNYNGDAIQQIIFLPYCPIHCPANKTKIIIWPNFYLNTKKTIYFL